MQPMPQPMRPEWPNTIPDVVRSGQLDALVALERIGTRQRVSRNREIYAEGESAQHWYEVLSGTVRVCKFLADGRRHIVEFYSAGDSFGLQSGAERGFSAEAVTDVTVMRYSRAATERALDESPALDRRLRELTLRSLAAAQGRLLLLGRMTAPERVAAFLLDTIERNDGNLRFDLPMSRGDIADYLGLTIETVCRILSDFKRRGIIAIPNPHRIEILDCDALEAIEED
ncbi:MAG TPA: helix-turn-helix domain-containing protein [Stellaceae bacterium]|nr:helix-turn-helix domain-containing protein [Stellaceae bacterium]